jgi:hypothetical protein
MVFLAKFQTWFIQIGIHIQISHKEHHNLRSTEFSHSTAAQSTNDIVIWKRKIIEKTTIAKTIENFKHC